jgi:hypothetical protein
MRPSVRAGSARNTSPLGASAMKRANCSESANTLIANPAGTASR